MFNQSTQLAEHVQKYLEAFFTKKHRYLADLILLLIVMIWGSTFIVTKNTLEGVDAVTMLVYRFGFCVVALIPFVAGKGQQLKALGKQGLIVGFLLWLMYITQNIGMQYTSASQSSFISALAVVFVPVFSILIFKRWPGIVRLSATLISVFGLWFLTGGFHSLNKGDYLTLLSAIACALYILYAHRYLAPDCDIFAFLFIQMLTVALLCLVFSIATQRSFAIHSGQALTSIIYLAIIATLITLVLYSYVQKIATPMRVTLIFALEPVFASFFASAFGGESLSFIQGFGGFLIVMAMVISETPFHKIEFFKKWMRDGK